MDDDVSQALGFKLRNPFFSDVPITYRMILSHQSSIGESNEYDNFVTYTYNLMKGPFPEIKELLQPGGKWYNTTTFKS